MSGLSARLGARRWGAVVESWSLTRQFVVTGGAIMLLAMVVEGLFTAEIIARNTIDRKAATTALFMDSILSPLAHHHLEGRRARRLLDDARTDRAPVRSSRGAARGHGGGGFGALHRPQGR
jgi:hypothetical protein